MKYQPPYTITSKIIHLIAQISESIGRLTALTQIQDSLKLRKANRIRTIQGSLAIEGNTLSTEQITAILNGKTIIAPPKEVQEVRNALKAYEEIQDWNPDQESHLLKAHQILMTGLIDEIGQYRHGGVGVMSGDRVVHMAPPANQVYRLMGELLQWLAEGNEHPVPPVILQGKEPGALALAKATQVHGVGNILAGENGIHRQGDEQRRDTGNLLDEAATYLFQLKAAGFLRVQGDGEVACQAGDKAKRQFHRVGQAVRQAKLAKRCTVGSRVHRVGDEDEQQ